MTITLTIGGVDRTKQVLWDTLRVESVLTRQIDTCEFTMMRSASLTYKPVAGREVIITADGTRIFGGVITSVEARPTAYSNIEYAIKCSDYARIMDAHLVAETYENMTVNAIIADLVATWFPAGVFTTVNVNAPVVVKYVQFNYLPGTEVMNRLAELTGYDWYVDYNKDIHFFLPAASTAPVTVQDDNGTYDYNSLVIRDDNTQLRNTIIVRGGEYLGTQFTAQILANGTDPVYPLPYRYDDFSCTVTGQRMTIGLDNIDDPNTHDVMYNYQEKIIKFRTSRIPTNGSVIRVGGKPHLPVIVKLKSQADINSTLSAEGIGDGRYEYLIVQKSINSKEGARQQALAQIATYAQTMVEGEFSSETAGFVPGQKVTINSVSRDINADYIINRVVTTALTPTQLRYDISIISTKTFGFVELLKRLLLQESDKIIIDPSEVTDLVEAASEEVTITDSMTQAAHNAQTEGITMTETFTAESLNYLVEFVLGEQARSGLKRQFILDGSPLG
jgi:hypothetical protein